MKMMMILALFAFNKSLSAQQSYTDSLSDFIKNYVAEHEVVSGSDKENFRFYPVDVRYRVIATFTPSQNSKWFSMPTSGSMSQVFRVYGTLNFKINDTAVSLPIYQSQGLMTNPKYKDHLFLPFTDLTSGEETYASGRYIDINIPEIVNNKLMIDFNKAYNPYCAYVSGKYNCPIPPAANRLPVTIRAGEKNFAGKH